MNSRGLSWAPVLFGMKLAFWVKHARRGTERHRNTNPTDQESDTEKAKPVKAGWENLQQNVFSPPVIGQHFLFAQNTDSMYLYVSLCFSCG